MINYVVGFMFTRDRDRLVLIRKTHPEWQKGLMNGVGGHMMEGENVHMAMSREFLEEAGVETLPLQWQHKFALLNRTVGYVLNVLVAFSDLAYEADSKTEELISLAHVDRVLNDPDVKQELIPNLTWIIPLLLDRDIRPGSVIEDVGNDSKRCSASCPHSVLEPHCCALMQGHSGPHNWVPEGGWQHPGDAA